MPDDPVMPPQRPMDALSRILMGIQDQQPQAIPQGPSAMTQAAQAMYGRPIAISSPPDDDVAPMPNAAATPAIPNAPVDAARSTLGAIKAPNRALAIAPPNPSQTDAGRAAMAQYSAPPPNPADFKPKWWERLLGGVTAGAMAYGHNPNALEAGSEVTNRRFNTAEGKYQQTHSQAGDVLNEQDRQFKNSEQSWRDMLNSQNANERIQSLEEERQAKEQKLQNAVDPNSIVKEDDGSFTGTTYGGKKVPVTPKGFQKPTEKDPTTYDQTVIQKYMAKYPQDRPRALEEAAKEIRQTELDKSKAGRSGRGGSGQLSAKDQMRVNAKAKTLGKDPEDLTDTEVNEALGVIKPGKPNAAMSKELRQSEDSKDEHYKQVDGEYRDMIQKAGTPEEKKALDEERIGKLQDVQNAWESELQRNNVDVDHFDVRTGKKASQYGEQKPQGAQAGKPSQKADFGPAPAGKKEGTTGMMGKTPVVVRNGRIVAQ